jgi:hypothetical protein
MSTARLEFTGCLDGDHVLSAHYASWVAGWQIRQALPALMAALTEDDPSPDLVLAWLDSGLKTALASVSSKAHQYVERIRSQLALLARFHAEEASPELWQVFKSIPDGIQWMDEPAMEQRLAGLQERGRQLALDCCSLHAADEAAQTFRGKPAIELTVRKSKTSLQKAIRIEHLRDAKPPYLRYSLDAPPDAADPCWLAEFLTLEFRCYHEYLSHVLPRNDDADRIFSDGYLFALQCWTYPGLTEVPAIAGYVERQVARRIDTDPKEAGFFSPHRDAARFYHLLAPEPFGKLLLHLAVRPFPAERPRLLGALLASMTNALRFDQDRELIAGLLRDKSKDPEAVVEWLLERQKRDRAAIRRAAG